MRKMRCFYKNNLENLQALGGGRGWRDP